MHRHAEQEQRRKVVTRVTTFRLFICIISNIYFFLKTTKTSEQRPQLFCLVLFNGPTTLNSKSNHLVQHNDQHYRKILLNRF